MMLTTTPSRPPSGVVRDCVIAAVHPHSTHLDQVVARAVSQAAATDTPIVFFTAITARPLDRELSLMRARLARYGFPIELIASWIDPNTTSPATVAALVAADIVAAAADLSAGAVVMGLEARGHLPSLSVAAQVAMTLPADTDLRLGPAGADLLMASDTPADAVGTGLARPRHPRRLTVGAS